MIQCLFFAQTEKLTMFAQTKNLRRRLKELHRDVPHVVVLYGAVFGEDLEFLEAQLRDQFTARTQFGEWYQLLPSDMKFIDNLPGFRHALEIDLDPEQMVIRVNRAEKIWLQQIADSLAARDGSRASIARALVFVRQTVLSTAGKVDEWLRMANQAEG